MDKTVVGWAPKTINLEWSIYNSLQFNYTIHKDEAMAITASGKENIRKVRVTIEEVQDGMSTDGIASGDKG